MALDPHGTKIGLGAPSYSAFTVTPDDNNDLPLATQYLWIGGNGNVRAQPADPTSPVVTLAGITAGSQIWGRFSRIYATGTTVGAGLIVGMV